MSNRNLPGRPVGSSTSYWRPWFAYGGGPDLVHPGWDETNLLVISPSARTNSALEMSDFEIARLTYRARNKQEVDARVETLTYVLIVFHEPTVQLRSAVATLWSICRGTVSSERGCPFTE